MQTTAGGRTPVDVGESSGKHGKQPGHGRLVLVLAAILLVGAVARVVALDSTPLWTDETLTVVIAQWPARTLFIEPIESSPGLYYVLHKLLIPAGSSTAAIRSISLAAGGAGIAAMFALARMMFGIRAAVLAAALFALSPPFIDYSQEARPYSLLIFLVLLSAIGAVGWGKALENHKPGRLLLLLFAGSAVLATYTHVTAFFWTAPAVALMCALTIKRGSLEQKRDLRLALLASGALVVPEIIRAGRYVGRDAFNWLGQATPLTFAATLVDSWLPTQLWRGQRVVSGPLQAAISSVALVTVLMAVAIARAGRLRGWCKAKPAAAGVIAILVCEPVLIWVAGFFATPMFMQRTILVSLIGFILLFVLLVEVSRAWVAAGLLCVAYAWALLAGGTQRTREDWRTVANLLVRNVRPGDAIIVCPYWKYGALRAAMPYPVEAPALFPHRGEMIEIEAQLGGDRPWARRYLQATVADYQAFRPAVPELRKPARPARRYWILSSGCQRFDGATLGRWIGRGTSKHVVTTVDAGPTVGGSIKLWLYQPAAPYPARSASTVRPVSPTSAKPPVTGIRSGAAPAVR